MNRDDVLLDGYLISYFQTGLKNLLDRAILDSPDFHAKAMVEKYKKLDEIPFDFTRRMMSVLVEDPEGKAILLTKGAPEEVFLHCSHFELDGKLSAMDPDRVVGLKQEYDDLSNDGFRVLAVATKELPGKQICAKEDERELVLRGYVAFLDPPKDTAARALAALHKHGVAVKILTGDNHLISRKVCKDVGLSADPMLLGGDVEKMSDAELAEAAEKAVLFARLSPAHKERVIRVLRGKGHVVGFMGDGINDAPALRAADVGISVDTATDIAKESADLILLEKDLMVLEGGVIEGRKVFANIVKYIRMGASSNFGNMFSVLGASAFLPFLPMAPIQVLTNNLLYDFSQVPIPADAVDEEQVARPRPWNIAEIKRFILFIGPISSIFDYTTFFVMLYIFNCWDPSRASLFQTGWFVESLMTQTLIIHVIRTNKIPFLQSRASLALTATTVSIMALGMWLPYSPLASALGFTHLPRAVLANPDAHAARLHGPYADHQSVAAAEALDLRPRICRWRHAPAPRTFWRFGSLTKVAVLEHGPSQYRCAAPNPVCYSRPRTRVPPNGFRATAPARPSPEASRLLRWCLRRRPATSLALRPSPIA